jgi:hypothetical protein
VTSLLLALGCGSGGSTPEAGVDGVGGDVAKDARDGSTSDVTTDTGDAIATDLVNASDVATDTSDAIATDLANTSDVATDTSDAIATDLVNVDRSATDAASDYLEAGQDGAADGASDAPPSRPCEAGSRWFDLAYPVAAVAYSRVLDVLLLLPTTEASLHIVDPESCSEMTIELPRRGLSLSVAPSGRTVAIGEDGELSIVDLTMARLVASYTISHPASEVAFDAKGRIQVYTRSVIGVLVPLLAVDAVSGSIAVAASGLNAAGHLRITPDGKALFWVFDGSSTEDTFAQVNPDTGAAGPLQNVAQSVRVCHGMFATDDSAHLITGCGIVLDLSTTQPPAPHGALDALDGVTYLQHADSSISKNVVVSIGRPDLLGSPAGVAQFVRVHTADTFDYVKRIDLPLLTTGSVTEPPSGRSVFIRSDGSRYYVLARRNGVADGIARLDPDATGQTVTTPIPVPAPPLYDTLPPATALPTAAVNLAFDVVDAAYSRSLDRLVVVSGKPAPAVLLVDPETGTAQTLATPSGPSNVFVRADGFIAAVLRTGGITFLDLRTGTILRDIETPSTQVGFGSDPQALVAPSGMSSLSWLDLGAGTTRFAYSAFSGNVAFATVSGTQSFYTATLGNASYPLTRHDDVASSTDPWVDVSMFTPDSNVLPPCGRQFWISDDGRHLVLDCGRSYHLAPTRAQDLVYAGGLEGVPSVKDVAHDGTSDRFFVVPNELFAGYATISQPAAIAVHGGDAPAMRALIDLKAVAAPGGPFSYPRRVFVGPANRLYVLANGSLPPYGAAILTVDVSAL